MTLEDLLQDHLRGCWIVNAKFLDESRLQVELHSGRSFIIEAHPVHGDNAELDITFEGERIFE